MWFSAQEVFVAGNLVIPKVTFDKSFQKINQKILANWEMTLNIVNIWSES